MRRRAAAAAMAATIAVTTTAACGISVENEAHRTAAGDVPFGLLEAAPEQTSTTTTVRPGPTVSVFLVAGERLVDVQRSAPVDDLGKHLDALLAGPTDAEAEAGLRTALPSTERVVVGAGHDESGIATVDLATGFGELPGGEQVLALAQIVFTLTARPGIGRVRFIVEGADVDVPRADGSLTRESVARDDYQALLMP